MNMKMRAVVAQLTIVGFCFINAFKTANILWLFVALIWAHAFYSTCKEHV